MTTDPRAWLLACATVAGATACLALPAEPGKTQGSLEQVAHVALERFMGDWYVIASIPTFIERDAHNAVESYRLERDGTIATTFSFRSGAFDGKSKRYTARGFVRDPSNAVWGMQFIWPIESDYRIAYITPEYDQTVIARIQRDHVWIMARAPHISDADYERLVDFVARQGYDVAGLRKVPQRWDTGAAASQDGR